MRNVVERIFGVAKKRFPVLKQGTHFVPEKQSRVIIALLTIFNFMVIFSPDHPDFAFDPEDWAETNFDTAMGQNTNPVADKGALGGEPDAAERRQADERRDQIARAMWTQYGAWKAAHGV